MTTIDGRECKECEAKDKYIDEMLDATINLLGTQGEWADIVAYVKGFRKREAAWRKKQQKE